MIGKDCSDLWSRDLFPRYGLWNTYMIKTMQDMHTENRTKFHTVMVFEWIFYKCSDLRYAEKIPNTIFRRLAPIFLKNGWIKSQYEINCKLAQTPRHIGAGPVDRTVTESSLSRWIRKPKSGFLEFWSLSYFQINFRFGFQNDKNILASLFWNHSTIFRNFQKDRFSIFLTIECFYI